MVKTYLRYEAREVLGLVCSPGATAKYLPGSQDKLAAAPCLEAVVIWNLKQGVPLHRLAVEDSKAQVGLIGSEAR